MAETVGPTDEAHILHSNERDNLSPQSHKPEASCDQNSCSFPPATTYVVQVPKNQIYRVPPPENAAIAERHSNENPASSAAAAKARSARRTCAARCCCCTCLILVPLVLILLIAAGLLSASLRPKIPLFALDRLAPSRGGGPFKASLKSDNPNSRLDFSYGSGGSTVSLWLGKTEVAAGRFPGFVHSHGSSEVVEISLQKKPAAAKEMEKLAAAKAKSTKLRLTMNGLAARKEMWSCSLGSVKFDVACEVTVDSLTPKNSTTTHVLSQECRTTKRD